MFFLFVMAISWARLTVSKCNSHDFGNRPNNLLVILFTFDFGKCRRKASLGALQQTLLCNTNKLYETESTVPSCTCGCMFDALYLLHIAFNVVATSLFEYAAVFPHCLPRRLLSCTNRVTDFLKMAVFFFVVFFPLAYV